MKADSTVFSGFWSCCRFFVCRTFCFSSVCWYSTLSSWKCVTQSSLALFHNILK